MGYILAVSNNIVTLKITKLGRQCKTFLSSNFKLPDSHVCTVTFQLFESHALVGFGVIDLSSATEWDSIIQHLPARDTASRIIVTTRSENIARHCSKKQENIYKLQILGYEDGLNLFMEKEPATLSSCIHALFV